MPAPIAILLVENSRQDMDLLLAYLRSGGLDFTHECVDNTAGLRALLDSQKWDIIISACALPFCEVSSILDILETSDRDIPLILIVKNDAEQQAALDLLTSGVVDYVMQDRLARLLPMIKRELVGAGHRHARKHAVEGLSQSGQRYRLLFEQASDGIFISDQNGRYLDVNPSGCALLGYTRAEILNLGMQDIVAPDDSLLIPLGLDDLRAGKTVIRERSLVCKDGSHVLVEISAKKLADGNLQGIVREITARKRAEQAILRMDRIYSVISHINQMMARTTRVPELLENVCSITVEQGKFRMAWFGLVDEQTETVNPVAVAGHEDGYLTIIPPISIRDVPSGRGPTGTAIREGRVVFCNDIANDRIMEPWREHALRRGYRSSIALPVLKKDVVVGAFTLYVSEPFFFNESEVRLLQQVTSDIGLGLEKIESEQKRLQAEGELRESQAFLSDVIENNAAQIFAKDQTGRYILVNREWEQGTGISREMAIGKKDPDLFPGTADEYRNNDIWVMEHGQALKTEEFLEEGGSKRYYITIKFPLRDKNGQINGICGISTDITDRMLAAEQLQEAHDRLEQRVAERVAELNVANLALQKAARMKDEFMASMSHELRTPLTGILGLSESLRLNTYGPLNDAQATALKMVEKSGRHLLELINEVLDLAKIEAGKIELQLGPCALDTICQASLQMVNSLAGQKHLHTSISMDPAAIVVWADGRRLKQMVVNLLSNAVKFTPEDGSLGMEILGNSDLKQVSISVWDTGIGIQPEDLPRLFQPFVQLDNSLSRQYAGTGLGLSLVQRLADLHGGSVHVKSVPGHGSRFTILLPWNMQTSSGQTPRRRATDQPAPPLPVMAPSGPLVLAVDDNAIMLEVFGDYLGAQNFGFIASHSGVEFLEKLERDHPDIVLVDIQMPGMDGLEVIKRIRANPDPRISAVRVVAVTALAMSGDRERCLAAGADEYLSKPVELTELADKLRNLHGRSGRSAKTEQI